MLYAEVIVNIRGEVYVPRKAALPHRERGKKKMPLRRPTFVHGRRVPRTVRAILLVADVVIRNGRYKYPALPEQRAHENHVEKREAVGEGWRGIGKGRVVNERNESNSQGLGST